MTASLFLIVPLLLLTGVIGGLLAGLLGVGGGIVIVPVLFLLSPALGVPADLAMHMAVGTSLATIIPTSIASAQSHHRKGAIDVPLLKGWAPFIFAGAAIGGIMSRYFGSDAMTGIFGVVALIVAVNMVLPRQIVLAEAPPRSVAGRGAIAAAIGWFSALMGLGGGALSVPVLSLFGFPVHRAVGTASAFGLVIAVPAVVGFVLAGQGIAGRPALSLGYVNVPAAVVIFTASTLCAPYGSKLAHWLSPRHLRIAFAVFLGFSALRMLSATFG